MGAVSSRTRPGFVTGEQSNSTKQQDKDSASTEDLQTVIQGCRS